MKQINSQKSQTRLRNKFIKSGVKMIGPETIFFKRSMAKCSCLLVQTAIEIFFSLHHLKKSLTPFMRVLCLIIFFP